MTVRLGTLLLGLLVAGMSSAEAATRVITVRDGEFDPPSLTVTQGDVVRWELEEGTFTLVSGSSPEDETRGQIFEIRLDRETPFFEWIPEKPGIYLYYAAERFETMTASVNVQAPSNVDRKTWGQLKNLFDNPTN